MTALIVIGIIVLIFAILLNVKIRAEVRYIGGTADIKVKYLFFTLFPFKVREKKEKKEKPKKKAKASKRGSETKDPTKTKASDSETISKESAEISEDSEADLSDEELLNPDSDKPKKKEKKSISERLDGLGEIIEKVEVIWGFAQKGLKRLFGRIRIDGLMIDFTIAGEDAYSTALNYGRISAVVYNAIGFVQVFFKTTVKSVDIVCDFNEKKSVYDCAAKITIAPSTILSAAFILLFGFLRNFRKIMGKPKTKTKAKNQPDTQEAVTV